MIPGAVSVGFLHPGKYSSCFADSLTQLLFFDAMSEAPRIVSHDHGQLASNCPPTGIVEGRNKLARIMCDDSEAEWLFMVDSDMAFDADIVERLIAAADPAERPIVGALAFAHKTDGRASLGGIRYRPVPTVYHWNETETEVGFVPQFDYPRDQLVPVAATGAACLLIHKTVFERLRVKFGDVWFEPLNHPKHQTHFSEDLSFCIRLAAADIPLFVHTGIRTGHDKGSQFLDEGLYDAHRASGSTSDTIDILIPTLGRPHRVAELVANIAETTSTQHRVVFIVEAHDQATIDACLAVGAEHVINERSPNYGGAINTGLAHTNGDWVFTGADDLHFVASWDVLCVKAADDWFPVVGTNDLLNQRVLRGQHATHSLVKRRYLRDMGGVIDEGPGSFLHEGYSHNFVDHEFVSTAKMRGLFRPCLSAVVEHVHHLNGKAPVDETYEKSVKDWDADLALFSSRCGLWAAL